MSNNVELRYIIKILHDIRERKETACAAFNRFDDEIQKGKYQACDEVERIVIEYLAKAAEETE
ncbi:hypothetical protein [Faecalibaculum rodentium]|uniref:hypothetical protein n=1 Tax=Faecalibaculum rodentium TaxID=1702221 RepID=UPI00259460D8|nr:hypothetical protein [Faecalibaculum rodentium]